MTTDQTPLKTTAEKPMDATLKAILIYTKKGDFGTGWVHLRDEVLGPLYHSEMSLINVLNVLLRTYELAIMEPRFALPGRHHAAQEIILAPIKGSFAIDFMGPQHGIDTTYSVEQFYQAMISQMLVNLRMTRVDWLIESGKLEPSSAWRIG